ncbi:HAD-IIB family hydrolase, partial [Eubacteriales bacterium OttesenSCG-928-N13]|nr:HAD-IIB family hydrolase [Eubacteriales bacterium OttesenSCG-928-N13]
GLDLNISSSWHDNIEVMSKDAAKGLALGALLDHFGLTRDQLMAFGDNDNDLDMLRAAGHPVAMQNAVPQLKQAAEIIAPHHDDSGVGQVIEEYILNDQTP